MSEVAYGRGITISPRSFPKEDIAVDVCEPVALRPMDSAPHTPWRVGGQDNCSFDRDQSVSSSVSNHSVRLRVWSV